ncbi:MAG: AI-2E family transporter YdiK [Deltaproteobacteria bacterium]|nr:AI-2E family transporter YdiK [Deltaproteobacteria bacterium]
MSAGKHSSPDLTRITLQVFLITALIIATFWILRPFLPSMIWAAMIVASTWPLMLKMEARLWHKRALAVSVMTLMILLFFIIPFSLAIAVIVENVDYITSWKHAFRLETMPAVQDWLTGIPVVGPKLATGWRDFVGGPEGLSARLAPYAGKMLTWFLSKAGSAGMIALQFLFTIIMAVIFYAKGEVFATGFIRFARKLGGAHGEEVVLLAIQTIRGVALGVVGTALIQSFLAGLGVAVCGVPAAAVLTAIMFMLCIAQLGPSLVLIPAIIWLYYSGETTWGTVLVAWAVFVSTFDNFVRPFLIRMGADLPFLLIFLGVIGGLVGFGVIGLFVGPVLLAVTYRLLAAWVDRSDENPGSMDTEEDPGMPRREPEHQKF